MSLSLGSLELAGDVVDELKSKLLDVIIVGGGPAGLNAALYAARYKLSTAVISEDVGGQVGKAGWVENYLGYERIMGPDLVSKFEQHVKSYGVPFLLDSVVAVRRDGDSFVVTTSSGDDLRSRTVILAVGERRRKLNVKGEKEFDGKGVSYCAPCDAPLFKDKVVAVVGGGDAAASASLLLTEYAKKVYIIHRRDKLRAEPTYQDMLRRNPKIEILWNTVVKELRGDKLLRSAILQRTDTGQEYGLSIDGIFVEIGAEPPVELFRGIGLKTDERGYVAVNNLMETSEPGIYAAGDAVNITPLDFRQITVAAGQGALAAYSAYNYILKRYGQVRQ